MLRLAVATVALLVAPASGWSLDPGRSLAQYTVDVWGEGEAPAQNFVYTLTQTREGYLWLGTRLGLARSDGVRFTTYDDRGPSPLLDSEVRALAEDEDGSLWVATHGGGLSRLTAGGFVSYSVEDGLASDTLTALAKAPGGPLWIGTAQGLTAFAAGRFRTFTVEDGLPSAGVTALHLDPSGVLWIGTSRGLAAFENGRVVNLAAAQPALGGTVRAIAGDRQRGLWLDGAAEATPGVRRDGLRRFRDGVVTSFTEKDGLVSDEVTALLLDDHGVLWIGTAEGLGRYREGRFEGPLPGTSEGPGSRGVASELRGIECLRVDHEGSLWVGTSSGLARVRNSFVSHVGAGGITSVYEDRRGTVWVASQQGLMRVGDRDATLYALPGSTPPLVVAGDDAGWIWVGTSQGVFRTRPGPIRFEGIPSLAGLAVTVLFDDGAGSLWIGTRTNGLYRWRDGDVTRYTSADGLGGDEVRALARTPDGALWVGTKDGGVTRLHQGRFLRLGADAGLPSPAVSALHAAGDGAVWAATRRGLARIHGGTITPVTARHGLPANYFYQILADEGGHLWLTFAGGIVKVAERELDEVADGRAQSLRASLFGADSGLRNTAMSISFQPAAMLARDGRLWFATGDGVAVVDPRMDLRNEVAPPVHVQEVLTDGKPRPLGGLIDVEPGKHDLEIRYTALSFLSPSRVLFRYRLEGFDAGWVDAGIRRTAYYTHLPPGKYRFRVKACNADGVWNEAGAAVELRLRPHFYETPWFYGAVALAVGLGGAATQRLHVRRLKRRAHELARRVDDALAQICVLRGMLPTCAWCRNVRDEAGNWIAMEDYISQHSEANFSHGICPDCAERLRRESAGGPRATA